MTILLSQAVRVGGAVLAAGTTQTMAADLEADLVTRKMATYTVAPMKSTVPLFGENDPLTGGIEIRGLANEGNNIAFIGDSRVRYGRREWFKNITPDNSDGIEADWLGVGPAVTVDSSVGVLEFRAADKAFRWTAPSDTAGEWVNASIGKTVIQSGSANKEIYFVLRSIVGLPTSDQSISMTCSGALFQKVEWLSAVTDVMSRYRNGPTAYYLGAGSAVTAECLEMLPWYNEQVSGPGVDVIRVGTNNISNASMTGAQMASDTLALCDARIAAGRKLVICGEHGRWGLNTSTALTAKQLADLISYNKLLRAYADARASSCRYVDLYSISRDPAYYDGRPLAGMLRDIVHEDVGGAIAFGAAIKAAIDSFGCCSVASYPMAGDASVLFTVAAWMTGTAGTIGTGATGQCPTGMAVSRASGADLTAVASIVGYSDHQGKRTHVDITSTTAGNILSVSSILPATSPTLASLGLVAGDTIEFEVDVEVVIGTPTQIEVFVNLAGTSRETSILIPCTPGIYHQKSAPIKLLAGDTTLRQQCYITMPASSTASVRLGEFVTRKL